MVRGVLALVLSGLAACGGEGPAQPTPGPEYQPELQYAAGWVGDYRGSGSGLVDGQAFEVRDATLRIAFDADSVKLASCPACLTISLDSVFALVNVAASDPVTLDLGYEDGSVAYALMLQRYSAAGEVGNVAQAHVTIGTIGVSTPFFDVTYLLARD